MSSRPRAAGATVGPFRLEQLLGGGHDTEVWRANGDGIIVALKLLRPGADALARARMAREAAVLAALDHPAIGWLLDAGEEDGEPYLAFTLYEAGTLAARLDRGRLGVAEAAATLAPVAEALAYVHERGIVHRDVKPGNVLLAPGGPVLVDFSIASITGSTYDGWIDGARAVAGTEGYRAPEAGAGPPAPGEDVYALGVTIVEAVTGARSPGGADELQGWLGPGLGAVVARCLSGDPAARPAAGEVAAALRSAAGTAAAPVEPAPSDVEVVVSSAPDTQRFARRADEVAQLVAAVDDGVEACELRAVVVVGPAGAGKTWLLEHAMARAGAGGRRVVAARCSEGAGDVSVLRPWLRPLLDREADAVEALARLVGPAPASAVARAVGLAHGGPVGGEGDLGVVADALAALLASMGGVVCVVEDLHHASLELLDLLSRLSQRSGVPGALWCTTRPGFIDPDDLDFSTLALAPLDDEAISAVVIDLVGAEMAVDVSRVVAVAGGNPLHAREAALAASRGDDVGALGSLPELIADRFSHLDAVTRDALEIAAACGDTFWPEAVGGRLLEATPALYQAGIAQVRMTSAIAGSTEAGWSHPLLQEVAYSSLDVARRRSLHAGLGVALSSAAASPEVVARHAGTAFRLGDASSAALAGSAGAAAARLALDRFALSGAESWIALVRDSGHEPAVGVTDVLDAELRIARGDFEAAARLVRPLTVRDDDVGARALVLATEATAGAGDLRAAERFGEAAHARLGDDPQLAASFGAVLARRGRLEDALRLLDASAETARAAGDEPLAARLAAQAADVAADLAEANAMPFADAIARTRAALAALRATGDRRQFVRSVDALFGMINIDHPQQALELALDAATIASSIDDPVAFGRAIVRVCDATLDLADVDTFETWRPTLREVSLPALERAKADLLDYTFQVLRTRDFAGVDAHYHQFAQRMRAAGDVRPKEAIGGAICAALWQGKVDDARTLLEATDALELPPIFREMFALAAHALAGPEWPLETLAEATSTSTYNERALIHLLRGEQEEANRLLRERHAHLLRTVGHARQRFTPYFSGALVAALGPADTEPDRAWLDRWIFDAPLPGLWIVTRAVVALLLAEQHKDRAGELATAALRLLESAEPDALVAEWIRVRASQLL